jgi:hypothetical protein
MFVGYALNHPGNTYHMWNPKTGVIHENQDIIWLKRMYYNQPEKEDEISPMEINGVNDKQQASEEVGEGNGNAEQEADPDEEEEEPEEEEEEEEEAEVKELTTVTRSGRVVIRVVSLATAA